MRDNDTYDHRYTRSAEDDEAQAEFESRLSIADAMVFARLPNPRKSAAFPIGARKEQERARIRISDHGWV